MSDVTGRRRELRQGMGVVPFVTLLLVAAVVASGVGSGPIFVGLFTFVAVALLSVVWQTVLLHRGLGPYAQAPPPRGPQPCPRCNATPRGPSGWCWPCFGSLQQSPLPPSHPLWNEDAIADLSDATIERTVAVHAPTCTVWGWTGEAVEVSRTFWRTNLRGLRRVFPDFCSTSEAAFVDPADSTIAWTRTRDHGHRRFGGPPLDLRTVTRYRFEHGLAVELWVAAPMPVA